MPDPAHDMSSMLAREMVAMRAFVVDRDSAVELRIKYWIIAATLAQVFAALPIIFFLGGIYQNANSSLKLLEAQQAELSKRGQWMAERQRWEDSVEIWAGPKGYVPPRYRAPKE